VTKNPWKAPLYAALLLLYLFHNDFWLWNDATLILGLPAGLVYHVGFSIATGIVLTLLVLKAWPAHLEVPDSEASGAGQR
jgi:hypothetical protein